jgi:hypothetical protein
MPKGQENVDKTVQTCRDMLGVLDRMSAGEPADFTSATELITGAVSGLEEISGKFFLKSNPSIPPTTACLKRAGELAAVLQTSDTTPEPDRVAAAVDNFRKAFEALAEKASMRSTVIT